MASLIRIDPLFPPLWSVVCEFFAQALEAGGGKRDWDLDDIYESALRNDIDLWALLDEDGIFGACVTAINTFPKRRALTVLLLGTHAHREDGWRICLDQLCDVARSVGATMITGTGRPGWARKLGCPERRVFEYEVPR